MRIVVNTFVIRCKNFQTPIQVATAKDAESKSIDSLESSHSMFFPFEVLNKKAGKTGIEPEYRGIITPIPALGLRF
jgi:hypothetical protein